MSLISIVSVMVNKLLTDPFLQTKAEIADLNIKQLESHRGSAIFAEKPRLVLFEIVSFFLPKIWFDADWHSTPPHNNLFILDDCVCV